MSLSWIQSPNKPLSEQHREMALSRQQQLTKPAGSLGRLEQLAVHLAAVQHSETPTCSKPFICVFAADHGIAAEGVSAFPQVVTSEMVKNFARGGAAICVLAKEANAPLTVHNLGTVVPTGDLPNVINHGLGEGTANFLEHPAMTEAQYQQALQIGHDVIEDATTKGHNVFIAGEMGIGNTTSAAALIATALDKSVSGIVGPGTGLDAEGVKHKSSIIAQGIQQHYLQLKSPHDILQRLGGFEIAAMCGAYIACAKFGMTALVDGYISSAAALMAELINPGTKDYLIFSHHSAEPGHKTVLKYFDTKAILDLQMRLGEGSGAATALPILQLACQLHNNMASFAQAEVSEKL